MTSAELALSVVRQQAFALAAQVPLIESETDPEHVHDARVATRRLRAALRVFDDVLPDAVLQLNQDLRWIAAQLGPVRDLDVQLLRLRATGLELGVSTDLVTYGAWLEQQRARAMAIYRDAVKSERFAVLTAALQGLERVTPVPESIPVELDAPERLKPEFRRLRRCAAHLNVDSPASDMHQARIRAKRLRYAVEFFEPIYGKSARRVIARATDLQDLLGDHQDGVVAAQRIHEAIQSAAAAWEAETSLALGQVVQFELQKGERLRRRARSAYRKLESAWKRLRDDF